MRVQGGARKRPPPQKQTKGLRPYRFAVGAAMTAGQSLSHAAHDSSLYTKEPWKNGAPICSLCKGAFFKPPLFAKGEVARSAGRDKPGVSLFQSGETRIYCARHCRTAFSLGHVLLCTLPVGKPRPSCLACISAFPSIKTTVRKDCRPPWPPKRQKISYEKRRALCPPFPSVPSFHKIRNLRFTADKRRRIFLPALC